MKRVIVATFLFGLCAFAQAADARRPMALVIMWDGMRADAVVNADVPNVRKLAFGTWQPGYKGAWSFCGKPIEDARPYSFSNHASIMNGVTRQKHGVSFNYNADVCRTDKWPCWLSRLMDAQPDKKTAFVYPSGKNWAACRDERVLHAQFGDDDAAKADWLAKLYSTDGAPDAAVLFTEQPDGTGHTKGYYPTSREYRDILKYNDDLLGKVLEAIVARPTFGDEDWLILLTADHGGYHFMHGHEDMHSRTTPIILAGRHVIGGQMAGFPRGQDVSATMLAHFGVSTEGMGLDSVVIGQEAASWGAADKLDEGLAWYFPMLAKSKCVVNAVKGGTAATLFGDEEYFNANRGNGKFATPCLWIGGDEDVPCGARLEASADMFAGRRPEFSLAFWAKMKKREGRQVLFGNKDFAREGSAGFVVTSGLHTERAANGMCLVFGTQDGKDAVVGTYDIEYDRWGFYAVVFTREGQAWFCQGRTDGSFHWICGRAERAVLGSGSQLCIGNDGTERYKWSYMDYLDDIAVWKRPLALEELRAIFTAGLKGQQLNDIASLGVKGQAAQDFMDTTEKAGIGK